MAWLAAVCLVAGWVATRGAAAAELSRLTVPPAEAAGALARDAEDGRRLGAQVAALQERLLADGARVRFWRELQARHEGVTSVTCANLASHAEAMARGEGRRRAVEPRRRLATAKFEPSAR
ncbi:hypothetical protein [Anaeromyxobacter paludicola]|uniref:Uncharacterized protein n=1 Tax=Anaeromyxobacter paludicola TaxID=2918171 RepID=A0ABN6NBF3_9BACT|nr:hypothetical protein [Anaeromyxobacter paludicola]BDG09736.1 hypothetical protein AMPC_28490 [Anaeromyxobacter paludicola]